MREVIETIDCLNEKVGSSQDILKDDGISITFLNSVM